MASEMPPGFDNDIHAKALALNLDPSIYGAFAEIGAGQEVARWFLRVGAASGTVSQAISAYDKKMSDERYGAGTRYVSRERLLAMLDREFEVLQQRLGGDRGATTRFFAFADTVAARNYWGNNQQHGWVGVRFQNKPQSPPSDILLHVNLIDPTAALQAEALGILGVNLLHAVYCRCESRDTLLEGLWHGLSTDRLEVDVIELAGPAFADAHAREWALAALRRGMCHAIVFDQSGQIIEPSAILRKRPLIVERGRFPRLAPFHARMLEAADRQLRAEPITLGRDPSPVLEMSIRHVENADPELADDAAVLQRVDTMVNLAPIILSNYAQTYLLIEYLRRLTTEPLRLVQGVSALSQLIQQHFYEGLPGTLLEGLGKLLAANVRIYAYPMSAADYEAALPGNASKYIQTGEPDGVITAQDLQPEPPVNHLYRYLLDAGWVIPLPETIVRGSAQ